MFLKQISHFVYVVRLLGIFTFHLQKYRCASKFCMIFSKWLWNKNFLWWRFILLHDRTWRVKRIPLSLFSFSRLGLDWQQNGNCPCSFSSVRAVFYSEYCYVNHWSRQTTCKQCRSGAATTLQNTVVFELAGVKNWGIPLPSRIACFDLKEYCSFADNLNFGDLTVFEYFKQLQLCNK